MSIKSFRDLIVWQKAMVLVTEIYGLTSQIRRSAISVPSNIAEGYGRNSTLDYTRFLQIARGSLYELQTQLEIAANIDYLQSAQYEEITHAINEIERMLNSLIRKLSDNL